jgi:hypothetical protein
MILDVGEGIEKEYIRGMVILNVDMLIPWVIEVPAPDIGGGEALILVKEIIGSQYPGRHILAGISGYLMLSYERTYIYSRLRNGTILYSSDQLWTKVAVWGISVPVGTS